MFRKNFFIFCLTFFTVSFGVAAMAALVPTVAVYFGVEQNCAVKLTWLYMLPYGTFALLWSPLTRIFKVKNIFLFTTLGFGLSAFFFSFSPTICQAFIYRFLMGCFGCSFVPLVLITIGKTVSPEEKSKYIGVLFALSYISTFLSVFLSGFVVWWGIVYLIPAVLSLVIFILGVIFMNDFDFRKEKFSISYKNTFKDREAVAFFFVIMVASFFYHSLQQRLGIYLSRTYFLEQKVISTIFTVSTLSAIVFEFAGGFLSARFGSIKVASVGFILMSIFTLFLLGIRDYRSLFIVIGLWGAGWALAHVGLSSYLTLLPEQVMRDASSLNSALRFSLGGLGAVAGGIIVDLMGFKALFVFVGAGVLYLGISLKKILNKKGVLWVS
ncbi:MAG TPA: MFS transporter [Candidatus Omnitrophica bacterium]|nr:MFS transporter [Candidatus Omnitrophota bacterium]